MFEGFSEEAVQFLWGVRLNNERSWFQLHKEDYLNHVYGPLKELAADVQARMAECYPDLPLNAKVSRIYRDARRLHGRGPYKTHMWFSLREPVEEESTAPAFYFELYPEGYEYGVGYYAAKPALMETYRRKILRESRRMERLARRLQRNKAYELVGEEYKRPKGQVSPCLTPWFNRKEVSICAPHPFDDRYETSALVEDIVEGFRFLMPYYQFFRELAQEPLLEG